MSGKTVPALVVVGLIGAATFGSCGASTDTYEPAAELSTAAAAAPAAVVPCASPTGLGLDKEQSVIAGHAMAAAKRAGVGAEGAVIAVAAGLVESGLRNLKHGDRDSIGWLQQRPSQGWKNAGNPAKAADDFYAALKREVPGWKGMDAGSVPDKVQHSRYPGRYAAKIPRARAIIAAMNGSSGCAAPSAPPPGKDCPASKFPKVESGLQPVAARGLRCGVQAFAGITKVGGRGGRPNKSDHPNGLAVDYMINGWKTTTGREYGDKVAAWWVANADEMNVTYIIWNVKIWKSRTREWRHYTHPNGSTDPTSLHMDHVHVSYKR